MKSRDGPAEELPVESSTFRPGWEDIFRMNQKQLEAAVMRVRACVVWCGARAGCTRAWHGAQPVRCEHSEVRVARVTHVCVYPGMHPPMNL